MSSIIGKDYTATRIMPILTDLLKDDNSEVKLNVVENLLQVAKIVGQDFFSKDVIGLLSNLTRDN